MINEKGLIEEMSFDALECTLTKIIGKQVKKIKVDLPDSLMNKEGCNVVKLIFDDNSELIIEACAFHAESYWLEINLEGV